MASHQGLNLQPSFLWAPKYLFEAVLLQTSPGISLTLCLCIPHLTPPFLDSTQDPGQAWLRVFP